MTKRLGEKCEAIYEQSGGAGNRTRVREASSSTFVHVRSRRIPGDWVRGFGRDLSLTNLDHAIEGALA